MQNLTPDEKERHLQALIDQMEADEHDPDMEAARIENDRQAAAVDNYLANLHDPDAHAQLIEDACEAEELFGLDELERFTEQWRKDHGL